MNWYGVERRYRVTDTVYVEAQTAKDAEAKVRNGDYDYVTDIEVVPGPSRRSLRASKRNGAPHWVWEEMGHPRNVPVSKT